MINFAYKIKDKNRKHLPLEAGYLVSLVVYLPKYLNLDKKEINNTWTIVGKIENDYIPVFIGDGILTKENTLSRYTIKKVEQVIYNALNNIVNIKCEKLGWFRKKYIITYNGKTVIKKGKFDLHIVLEEIIKKDFNEWYSGLLI